MSKPSNMTEHYYQATIEILYERIVKLLPQHPEILEMQSPFELFKIKEFNTLGLDTTLAQAVAVLSKIKAEHATQATQ